MQLMVTPGEVSYDAFKLIIGYVALSDFHKDCWFLFVCLTLIGITESRECLVTHCNHVRAAFMTEDKTAAAS